MEDLARVGGHRHAERVGYKIFPHASLTLAHAADRVLSDPFYRSWRQPWRVLAGRPAGQNLWVASDVVWRPRPLGAGPQRLAVVSASYYTRELTEFLLWSLRRIVNWPGLEIVIVDNGSRDGSAELLAEAGQAGVCMRLVNDVNH